MEIKVYQKITIYNKYLLYFFLSITRTQHTHARTHFVNAHANNAHARAHTPYVNNLRYVILRIREIHNA